ncbi:Mur ligase domain-containing protein [Candidatus Phycosocius spiralis]|uniref:UDP-N-acetylmuramate:L-alanyl-gamma-D-glutamyl-meso-diaminopimelate ligase n=1 Tax=Candidatus Phycosocius spiralis TaxID=2815099 RepID=A0ABQ4PUS7_9PROT|nr:Mur ligase domain-containing protein [Candidatus Phycosocius spiralis]GIU66726.1 UDP-N-acetylmuramate:L-alanyl-gamma-D-glutamyl-meso-diaminopimelate ligase [Candidatus Phycosocius spiralis]
MHIYFLGIAGAGMSALACLLQSQGHEVSGSDDGVFPPISSYLDKAGIAYKTGFDAKSLPDHIDAAIIGTSAKLRLATNPEFKELMARGVPCYNFATYLGEITKTRENLIVAGSFGKSSLTALIAFLLVHAGKDPGWFIGAIPLDLPETGHAGLDPLFVVEGDEYVISLEDHRSKFELYEPAHVLISSIVHDHINMFPTMAEYEAPFQRLINRAKPTGLLLACYAYEPVRRLIGDKAATWYGLAPNPGYYAADIQIGPITHFSLCRPNGEKIKLKTELLGLHNIENLIGGCAFLLERGLVTQAELQSGVKAFRGVARRLDKKTKSSIVPVYEGFGSSYEKARSAIEAVKLHFPNQPIQVIFEPHTFSWRDPSAITWYDTVFEGCDHIFILPPPKIGDNSSSQLSLDQILARVRANGIMASGIVDTQAFSKDFTQGLKGNEVILFLSSGPLAGLADHLPPMLDAHFGTKDLD